MLQMDCPIYSDVRYIFVESDSAATHPTRGRKKRENNIGDEKREQISLTKIQLALNLKPACHIYAIEPRFYYNVVYHSHSFLL